MFKAPERKVKITREIDDDFFKPAEVLFKPEQEKIVAQLIEEFLNIPNTSQEHKEEISILAFLMTKTKEYRDFYKLTIEFKKIIAIYNSRKEELWSTKRKYLLAT